MTRVSIDLNVRVQHNWTFAGIEEASGPVHVGESVEVYESESGLQGIARVEVVDEARRLIYLSLDWGALAAPAPSTVAARLGALFNFSTFNTFSGASAGSSSQPVFGRPLPGRITFAA